MVCLKFLGICVQLIMSGLSVFSFHIPGLMKYWLHRKPTRWAKVWQSILL